jgi:hypothetical protein
LTLAVLGVTGTALAAPGETSAYRELARNEPQWWGNEDVGAGYDFQTSARVWHGWNGGSFVNNYAYFAVRAKVLGSERSFLRLYSDTYQEKNPSYNAQRTGGWIEIGGDVVQSAEYTGWYNASYNWSGTFVSGSKTFPVGPVGVTVAGSLAGELGGSVAGAINAAPYGEWTSDRTDASLGGSARLFAKFNAKVGWGSALSVGVRGEVDLITASVTPTTTVVRYERPSWGEGDTDNFFYYLNNAAPVTLSSLSGRADAFAEVAWLWEPSTNIITWQGYSWGGELWNDAAGEYFKSP